MVSMPCFSDQAKPVILYIEETGLSFKELVDRIATSTGYRIDLVGEWPNDRINTRLKGIALDDGLDRIIRELGENSYALIFDGEGKHVKVVRLLEGAASDSSVIEKPPVSVNAEVISPPSASGEPGLTERRLSAIKSEYREAQHNQAGETLILPATEYGPGLTMEELEAIKNAYDLELEAGEGHAYVITPSAAYGGLSKTGLEKIKSAHSKQRSLEGPDTPLTPDSQYGPGLTLGELTEIRRAYSAERIEGNVLVSPPSSQGPGLTLDELEAIKDAYREKNN